MTDALHWQFHEGDIVQLNSGGPIMTITGTYVEYCTCHWFNKRNDICSDRFTYETIKKYENKANPPGPDLPKG